MEMAHLLGWIRGDISWGMVPSGYVKIAIENGD